MPHIPRILFTAPYSAGGKTTFACGFLRALMHRGLRVSAFKCGPDYVDAMYHKYTLHAPTQNIDLFFRGVDAIRGAIVSEGKGSDFTVIEGVMGLYDGMGGVSEQSSTWDMAGQTKTPAVLIVHARGITLTAAAIVKGLQAMRRQSCLQAVVLNNCSEMLYQKLAPVMERETGLPVMGYLPSDESYAFPMRHLGLVMPPEIPDFDRRMDALARQMERTVDMDGLIRLGGGRSASGGGIRSIRAYCGGKSGHCGGL